MKLTAFNHGKLPVVFNPFALAALLCGAFLLPTPAIGLEGNPAETSRNISTHKVVQGDTLYKLAHTYLDDSAKWREFLRYNQVKNPRHLVPGSELYIPPSNAYATVIFAHGEVTLATGSTQGKAVEVGDTLTEGATVTVGNNSYLSLQFSDNSIVRVLSDSVLQLRKIREFNNVKTPKLSRIMQLEQGNLDISVTPFKNAHPSRKARSNTFEIITPMAVAAVRGTRFDVSASNTGTTSGVTRGSVDIRQNTPGKTAKHATLETGTGIVVNNDGKLGTVRALLPAPDLSSLPETIQDVDYIALNWPALPGAAQYHIRVAADAEMHTVLQNLESDTPTLKLRGLANGDYVVGIRAVDADGVIGYEATRAIKVMADPAYPFYLQPSNMQIVGDTVLLECTEVAGASAYHMQISRNETFIGDVIEADQLGTCSHTVTKLTNGHYYWRAAAIAKTGNGDSLQGPYTSPSRFEVNESYAGSKEHAAIAYWLDNRPLAVTAQIASDAGFTTILQEKAIENNQVSLEGLPSGTYYLRLQGTDHEGYTGAFTTARIVEIKVIEQAIERTWADKAK